MNNSIMKCVLCNNEQIGEFITINDKKYHLCCIEDLQKQNAKLKQKYNEVLTMLADHYPPCELDGFIDKNTDYCSVNCGVDEEIFKECWDRYIKQRLEEK